MSISISTLKAKGLLSRDGTIMEDLNWINSSTKAEAGTVGLTICTQCADPYIRVSYSIGRKDFEYSIPLIKELSNLGRGYIWYFKIENKRCSKVYLLNEHFVSRQVILDAGGAYASQIVSKRVSRMNMEFDQVKRLFKITLQEIKPHFLSTYRGIVTKRQRSVDRAKKQLMRMGLGTYSAIQEYFGMG